MLSAPQIVSFDDAAAPPGESAWVAGAEPMRTMDIVAPDPVWPERFTALAGDIRRALGDTAVAIEHVGSTAVPGLAAKPVIDIDLTVADPRDEAAYVPPLKRLGYRLVVREPWWYEHRCLRAEDSLALIHVFAPDCPEAARHLIFRDWLSENAADRARYQTTKLDAMDATRAAAGHVMDYNAAKQAVIREIYHRAFHARGLLA